MQKDAYAELDLLAAPDRYTASLTEEDQAYTLRFREVCRRYQIDFSKADEDERDFVMRMTEKSLAQKRA